MAHPQAAVVGRYQGLSWIGKKATKLKAESSKPDILNIGFELSALSLELSILFN